MNYEIWWDDLTPKAQDRLWALKHDNIDLSPIAIIDIEDEETNEVLTQQSREDAEDQRMFSELLPKQYKPEECEPYVSNGSLYRSLTAEEVADFRNWARTNYSTNVPVSTAWHPIVVEECKLMQKEHELDQSICRTMPNSESAPINEDLPLTFMYNGKIFDKQIDGMYHFFSPDKDRVRSNSLGSITIAAAKHIFKTSRFIGSVIVLSDHVNQKI